MVELWSREGSHIQRCYFCDSETNSACRKCNKPTCDTHSFVDRQDSYERLGGSYCPICFEKLEKKKTKRMRTIILATALAITIVVVIVLLYSRLSSGF